MAEYGVVAGLEGAEHGIGVAAFLALVPGTAPLRELAGVQGGALVVALSATALGGLLSSLIEARAHHG